MIKCLECEKEFKNNHNLSNHIRVHKLSSKEYYDKYYKKDNEGICKCGTETTYKSLNIGYHIFCSSPCVSRSNDVRKKYKNTCFLKYGVDNISKDENIKIKKEKTFNEKYGCKTSLLNKDIKLKIKSTMIEKYGEDHPSKLYIVKNKKRDNYVKKYIIILDEILSKNNLELINEYNGGSRSELIIRCKNCGKEFITCQFNLSQGYGKCPSCFPINQSKGERDIINFLKTFNIKNISTKNKFVIQPYELDIYLPTFNIAIEYNGLYWHSEEKINKNYHLNKTELCESKNIQLIHIFEDEWLFKKEIVKSRLKQILNLNSDLTKIYSEECEIKEISTEIKNEFLEKYHLQGFDSSNIKLGAFYNDELVSVMTFLKIREDIYELSKFCFNYNCNIYNIINELLSYFKNNYQWKEIFFYCDRRWDKGDLYYKLDFKLDNIIDSDYWYTDGFKRFNKFDFEKLKNNNYYRIWDCGYYKFIMKNTKEI